jgi:hypothetical protein
MKRNKKKSPNKAKPPKEEPKHTLDEITDLEAEEITGGTLTYQSYPVATSSTIKAVQTTRFVITPADTTPNTDSPPLNN